MLVKASEILNKYPSGMKLLRFQGCGTDRMPNGIVGENVR